MDNELLTQRLESMLAYVEEGVKASASFAAEQAPLVVQEYLAWYWWSAVFLAVLFGFIGLVLISFATWLIRKDPDSDAIAPLLFMWIAGALFFFIGVGNNVYDMVKVSVAPRVVVLEQIGKLIK